MLSNNSLPILITTSSFGTYDKSVVQTLEKINASITMNPYGRKLTIEEVDYFLKETSAVGMIAGVETLNSKVLRAASELRVISRCGTELNNINLKETKALGIKVFNTPEAPVRAVAELTLGLILDCLRKITHANNLIRKKIWKAQMGNLLLNKTVGVVGLGRIGKEVAKLVGVLGANVIFSDPNVFSFRKANKVSFSELIRASDIISFHTSCTDNSPHLVGEQEFKKMKKGVIIINTSRGNIIDETALINHLSSGTVSSAGLDVFQAEPYTGPLIFNDNVVLTSHMGSYAKESRIEMERQAVNNLINGLISCKIIKRQESLCCL